MAAQQLKRSLPRVLEVADENDVYMAQPVKRQRQGAEVSEDDVEVQSKCQGYWSDDDAQSSASSDRLNDARNNLAVDGSCEAEDLTLALRDALQDMFFLKQKLLTFPPEVRKQIIATAFQASGQPASNTACF